uniref:Uncharacterized protein n=1 Tax=Euplotes crassus TaxID=5936 RepID=A0A7S3KCN9_EUPCR|mmetsp:Transcript_17413/g.17140  ORF Transcript_17413/g.17140 Transcript_17413/m.17140 type:complete len:120 (+) Transcript_17413:146-505(+)
MLSKRFSVHATPFQKKEYFKKAVSLAVQKKVDEDRSHLLEQGKENKTKKFLTQSYGGHKNLQSDIRNLLHKAMKLRNLYDMEFEHDDKFDWPDSPCQRVDEVDSRVVTMADVQKPSEPI